MTRGKDSYNLVYAPNPAPSDQGKFSGRLLWHGEGWLRLDRPVPVLTMPHKQPACFAKWKSRPLSTLQKKDRKRKTKIQGKLEEGSVLCVRIYLLVLKATPVRDTQVSLVLCKVMVQAYFPPAKMEHAGEGGAGGGAKPVPPKLFNGFLGNKLGVGWKKYDETNKLNPWLHTFLFRHRSTSHLSWYSYPDG